MAHRTATILMILSDLEGHSPTEGLFNCDFFVRLCSRWQDFSWHSVAHSLLSKMGFL